MGKKKKDNEEESVWFRNHYTCSECGEEWYDEWDCMCNDRCPTCDTETEPDESEEIPKD